MKALPTPVNPLADPWCGRHEARVSGKDKEREERLAAALRDNLRRRKAQAREIGAADEKKDDA